MEIATLPPNTIVQEVLEKQNYRKWSVLMKHYLVAQDVWDVIDQPRPTTEETDERVWRKKNALALHAIKISCGAKAFARIEKIDSAKDAWEKLLGLQKPQVYYEMNELQEVVSLDIADPHQTERQKDFLKSICNGNKSRVERFFYANPDAKSDDEELLIYALQVAITAGQEDTARYLYRRTSPEFLRGKNGFILLQDCITKKIFDIAFDLLQRFPELATKEPPCGYEPTILTLAKTPPPFFRGSQLKFLRSWIYCGIIVADCKPSDREKHSYYQSFQETLGILVANLSKILAKQIYDLKSTDVHAGEVVRLLCQKLSKLDHNQFGQNKGVEATFHAIKNGIPEVAIELVEANADILSNSTDPEDSRNMFAYAVLHRQEKVARFLYDRDKNAYFTTDEDGNNTLHLAAKLAPHFQLDHIAGAALQLQSELRWFKSVEAIVPRHFNGNKNKDYETPSQVFAREHRNLLKEAEEWIKKTAESSTVVGALIITIMFAAAFTLPGGNDQNTGFPIFLNTTASVNSLTVTPFKVFIVADAISLFTASSSVLMFLGILTSRYAYEDFLISLPMKLIVGLSSLFISIATLTVAFCATLYVTLQCRLKEVIPVIVVAVVPIMCFVLLQSPLLVEIISLTFRRKIFEGKTLRAQLAQMFAGYTPIIPSLAQAVGTRLNRPIKKVEMDSLS